MGVRANDQARTSKDIIATPGENTTALRNSLDRSGTASNPDEDGAGRQKEYRVKKPCKGSSNLKVFHQFLKPIVF
jgi:hypothetical protein